MIIFEIIMLICFGVAWPFSIYKSLKSKSNEGKSIIFLIIILIGYLSGLIHKFINSKDFVIVFYFINFIMVFLDLLIYIRNYYKVY